MKWDKVDILNPTNKKRVVVGHGQVEGIGGDMVHLKKIEEGLIKVVVWCVVEGDILLFESNENDDPPQRLLKDVEGIIILWEEANLQLV